MQDNYRRTQQEAHDDQLIQMAQDNYRRTQQEAHDDQLIQMAQDNYRRTQQEAQDNYRRAHQPKRTKPGKPQSFLEDITLAVALLSLSLSVMAALTMAAVLWF